LIQPTDEILLQKQSLIERVNDQLKNIVPIEYSVHRSLVTFIVSLLTTLIAYSYREKNPLLNLQLQKPYPTSFYGLLVAITLKERTQLS
jgi:hypothetical protein